MKKTSVKNIPTSSYKCFTLFNHLIWICTFFRGLGGGVMCLKCVAIPLGSDCFCIRLKWCCLNLLCASPHLFQSHPFSVAAKEVSSVKPGYLYPSQLTFREICPPASSSAEISPRGSQVLAGVENTLMPTNTTCSHQPHFLQKEGKLKNHRSVNYCT